MPIYTYIAFSHLTALSIQIYRPKTMKSICFLTVSVLLAVSFCNSASRTVQEGTGSIHSRSIHKGLAELPAADFSGHQYASEERVMQAAMRKGVKTIIKTHGLVGGSRDVTDQIEKAASTNCLSEEHCSKNKVVCSKKCIDLQGHDVKRGHVSAKCTIKCKKCVPNC